MPNPMSPIDVEREILRLMQLLEDVTDEFEDISVDASEKEAEYKMAWTKDYISQQGKGPIKDREAWADYKNAPLYREWKLAEALTKAKRERLTSIRTGLDALRTLNANLRNIIG